MGGLGNRQGRRGIKVCLKKLNLPVAVSDREFVGQKAPFFCVNLRGMEFLDVLCLDKTNLLPYIEKKLLCTKGGL